MRTACRFAVHCFAYLVSPNRVRLESSDSERRRVTNEWKGCTVALRTPSVSSLRFHLPQLVIWDLYPCEVGNYMAKTGLSPSDLDRIRWKAHKLTI